MQDPASALHILKQLQYCCILWRRRASAWVSMTRHPSPEVSQRVRTTTDPIMVQMRRLLGSVDDVLSLGQGASSMLHGLPFPAPWQQVC